MAELPVPIPVTVIGGYLGAGKTTLLNDVLSGDHGLRIAVLVNDFGIISIDEKLITNRDGNVVSLSNGCACCSISGDLGDALDRFARSEPRPERILIEASGVADPARIAALAGAPGLRAAGIIVLADAETLIARSADKFVGRLVRDQLAGADLIVLNKIDLVDSRRLPTLRKWLHKNINSPILETVRSSLPHELLLNATVSAEFPGQFWSEPADKDPSMSFESYSWTSRDTVDLVELLPMLSSLPETVVRIKGVVARQGNIERPTVLHRVGRRLNIERMPDTTRHLRTELVFIAIAGTLDIPGLKDALDKCTSVGVI